MASNRFGNVFTLTTFGESHGLAMGAVVDGCPAGVVWNQEMLTRFLERRRPGGALASGRQEPDQVELLSGVFENLTLGTPIATLVRNLDARSTEYTSEKLAARPGHAADLWQSKYGHSDPRGSGRASGRETVSRVMGGAVARMFVTQVCPEAQVMAFVSRVGLVGLSELDCVDAAEAIEGDPWHVDEFSMRCPFQDKNDQIEELVRAAKGSGESYGGEVFLRISGVPAGLGQPVFGKLKSELASAFMSVGAVLGVEFGDGFQASRLSGQEYYRSRQDHGGIRGGISTGDPISFRVAFKPTSTRKDMALEGRHDPTIVPRAVPVLEAMSWLVIADQLLMTRLDR